MQKLFLLLFLFLAFSNCKNKSKSKQTKKSQTSDSVATASYVKELPIKVDSSFMNTILIKQASYESEAYRTFNKLDTNYQLYENKLYNGIVVLRNEHWERTSAIPFVVIVSGKVKELFIDNKKQKIEGPDEYFFRVNLNLEGGYNRIAVKAVSNNDFVTKGYVELNVTFKK